MTAFFVSTPQIGDLRGLPMESCDLVERRIRLSDVEGYCTAASLLSTALAVDADPSAAGVGPNAKPFLPIRAGDLVLGNADGTVLNIPGIIMEAFRARSSLECGTGMSNPYLRCSRYQCR